MNRDDEQENIKDFNQNTTPGDESNTDNLDRNDSQIDLSDTAPIAEPREETSADIDSAEPATSVQDDQVRSDGVDNTVEVESSTVEQEPATSMSDTPPAGTATTPTTTAPDLKPKDKKRLIVMAAVSVVAFIAIGFLVWWLIFGGKKPNTTNTDDTSSSTIEQSRLGIALTVIDGVVRFSSDGENWQAATAESQLSEGDYIQTDPDSRAVLTLDDGSAVRLDADSTIKLASLLANSIEIEQVAGSVYSRVVTSERKYVVRVDETTYTALGTAFLTLRNTSSSGVQVFQSSVESSELGEVIPEGKQYLKPFGDFVGEIAVEDINIDDATGDEFINWNLAQDESDAKFKEKLGILEKVKLRAEEMRREQEAADENSRAEVDRIIQERLAAEKKKEETSTKERVTRGAMTLSRKGDTFYWNYTGKAVHGYKLVYSKDTEEPTFGKDDAVYFSNINDNSGALPKKDKIGEGKFYVRVCAYTAGTETEGCVDYSSVVIKDV